MPNRTADIYTKIFISSFLVTRCAFSRCHSHTAILRMRILTLPFSGCAFSRCHSHNAILTMRIITIKFSVQNYRLTHSHAAILRMRILTLPFSGCAFSQCHSHNAQPHTYNSNNNYMFIVYIYLWIIFLLDCSTLPCPPEPCLILISQPDIIARLERYFGLEVQHLKEYKTPLPAHYHVVRPTNTTDVLSKTDMLKYRSGTGSLLYLVKHLRIDIANAVRELSKVMDKATPSHMKELLRCIRYVLLTRERKLKFKLSTSDKVRVRAICDSTMLEIPKLGEVFPDLWFM